MDEPPIFDTIDLKNQIKAAKAQLIILDLENQKLQQKLTIETSKSEDLRSEYNNIQHNEALIYIDNDIIAGQQEVFPENDKFTEQHTKLELQILNDNIKQNLIKLESTAKKLEKEAHITDKTIHKLNQNSFTMNFMLKSINELEKEIKQYKTMKDELTHQINEKNSILLCEKSKNNRKISKLRSEIEDLINQNEIYRNNTEKYKINYLSKQYLIDYLLLLHNNLRTNINNSSLLMNHTNTQIADTKINENISNWIYEAFQFETNCNINNINEYYIIKDNLLKVLNLWFNLNELNNLNIENNIENILKQKDNINWIQFQTICQQIIQSNLNK